MLLLRGINIAVKKVNLENYRAIKQELGPTKTKLIAVSKTKTAKEILTLYHEGQRIFGENKAQEMEEKYTQLPKDIEWHFIGHLQTNKVKYIAPFVRMIHSVDSLKLLMEIDKCALRSNRQIACLFQIHIAKEETKFGLNEEELNEVLNAKEYASMRNVQMRGLMGMATNTTDETVIHQEFAQLKEISDRVKTRFLSKQNDFSQLSIGMSSDYRLALQHGSTYVRIGSLIFGERTPETEEEINDTA